MKIKNISKQNLWTIIVHPRLRKLTSVLPDRTYVKCMFRAKMGTPLHLEAPKTFNEKLQWLKLNDRNPLYSTLVDKYEVKKYIGDKIGTQYVIPNLGVWDHFEDIDFDQLPEQFVLKCTHDSGGVAIIRSKSRMDREKTGEILSQRLSREYFYEGREWPYKNIPKRIIAEPLMSDGADSEEFTDYKFYCFNGDVDCVMVCCDRLSGDTKYYFFDEQWNLKRINKRGVEAPENFTLPKPVCMDEMFEIASKLSKGIPFVRVDLYASNGQVYFGEMTFYPQSGVDPNYLPETDLYFGSLIDLKQAYAEKEKLK